MHHFSVEKACHTMRRCLRDPVFRPFWYTILVYVGRG